MFIPRQLVYETGRVKTAMKNYGISKQQGTVLVLSLIILSVLTLVAVTGMKTSINEEKMSGNIRDRELALQAAESAMRDGTNTVDAFTAKADLTGTDGLLDILDVEEQYLEKDTWTTAANYTDAPYLGGSGNLADVPKGVRGIGSNIGINSRQRAVGIG